MLSSRLLPVLREQFAGRGLIEGTLPDPCAMFPGIHPGIRSVSIYDDAHELTVSIDCLTHTHFAEPHAALPEAERERRIIEAVVRFLEDLFSDRVVVWGRLNIGGGWYDVDRVSLAHPPDVPGFVWSGPWTYRPAEDR